MKYIPIIIISITLAIYLVLRYAGREYSELYDEAIIIRMDEEAFNFNDGKKIIGIQTRMDNADYSSELHFKTKIESYLTALRKKGIRIDSSIVVYPEHIGTWLVAADEHRWISESKNINSAMALLAYAQFPQVLRNYFGCPDEISDALVHSIFRTKASKMHHIYQSTFTELAKKYSVYIVAGSIVLPKVINNGSGSVESKLLYNSSYLFHPDGTVDSAVVRKVFPIISELGFTSSGGLNELPVYELPMGRMSVLICADSWSLEVLKHIDRQNPDHILVPSFASGDYSMSQKWKGFNGQPDSPDLDLNDIDSITEGQAWDKYALASRINESNATIGLNVFLRGQLWDLGSDGTSWIFDKPSNAQLSSQSGLSEIIIMNINKKVGEQVLTEIKESNAIHLDLRYATEDNFTQKKIYPCARCFLQAELANKIKLISIELSEKYQLKLKLFDCYRPQKYQDRLWEIVPDARYVTPPTRGSMHARGLAIDLTLTDLKNQELEMGSPYDHFGPASHTDHENFTEEVKRNRAILNALMNKHGLVGIRTEWWHFFLPGESEVLDWEWGCY